MPSRLLLATSVAAALLLGACSPGLACDELPELRAERDAARQAYLDLALSEEASPDDTEQADSALHALERRVYDLEQGCEGR